MGEGGGKKAGVQRHGDGMREVVRWNKEGRGGKRKMRERREVGKKLGWIGGERGWSGVGGKRRAWESEGGASGRRIGGVGDCRGGKDKEGGGGEGEGGNEGEGEG